MSAPTGEVRWSAADVPLRGGSLCLDYANTVDRQSDDQPWRPETSDVLTTANSLAVWAARMGIPAPDRLQAAELRPARELRDAVCRLFSAIASGAVPTPADLETVRRTYASAVRAATLGPCDDGWSWRWAPGEARALRFAVAADAIALLQDADRLARVSRCPGENCGWLFINASGRRRWCAMSACGSRHKSRRAYHRKASETEGDAQPARSSSIIWRNRFPS
jgi:predicted RNA-binding Zn ribbon-like protein